MRHRLLSRLAVLSAVPAAVALPVVSRPPVSPAPVQSVVRELTVRGIDAHAARGLVRFDGSAGPVAAAPVALTPAIPTARFSLVGVTWAGQAGTGEVAAAVRVRQGGRWSGWQALSTDPDEGPDVGSVDLAGPRVRGGSAPLWVGDANGVQVKVAAAGRAPRDVRVTLVDPGRSAADASLGTPHTLGGSVASAAVARPTFITRAQWGADESIRRGKPSYSPSAKIGFVHHTDGSNTYSAAQAASVVRGVYAFHVNGRGWSDIGYNVLVDRYGRAYEGRYGGLDKTVVGAHTGGFNSSSFGVSLMGNFSNVAPPATMLDTLQQVLAWKLAINHRDPARTDTLTSAGGGTSKYASGTTVRFAVVSGHRDAGSTSCPGQQTYNRLPAIRSAVRALIGPGVVNPLVTNPTPMYLAGGSIGLTADVLQSQSWTLSVMDKATATVVRRAAGLASPTAPITTSWDGKTDLGTPALPGYYQLRLESANTSGVTAVPFTADVEIRSPLPSGLTVRDRGSTVRLLRGGRRQTPTPALLAALRPTDTPIDAAANQLAAFAAPITSIPDGAAVRSAAGTTYVVTGGERRAVSASTASALGLPASPPALPDTLLVTTPEGPAWTRADRHPDGMLVTAGATTYRIEAGRRRRLVSPAATASWGTGRVRATATTADLALPEAAPLGPAEGSLLRLPDGGGAVVSDGRVRVLSAAVAGALGYDVAGAPAATSADLASLPAGEPWTAVDRHPSGALLRSSTGAYFSVVGDHWVRVDVRLVPLDSRRPVAAVTNELSTLREALMAAPRGTAGRGADGLVRVVDGDRLVTLDASTASSLGYDGAALPALDPADFGPLAPAPALADGARHPDGTLVRQTTTTWLVVGAERRAVASSVLGTYAGRPVLSATSADLAVPVVGAAAPPTGSWVRTEDGATWLVDDGARRSVTLEVARRIGLDRSTPYTVLASELNAATRPGPPVP